LKPWLDLKKLNIEENDLEPVLILNPVFIGVTFEINKSCKNIL